MEKFHEIDWREISTDEIKVLYKAVLRSRQDHNLSWYGLFKKAFGGLYVGKGYEDNFRKGKIAAARAEQAFLWLQTKSPVIADQLEDEIFSIRTAQKDGNTSSINWSELLQSRCVYGRVKVFNYTITGPSIVAFADQNQVSEASLLLGDWFYFHVNCTHSGRLAALQHYRGNWYSFPLSPEQASIPANLGAVPAPISVTDQKIEPISEETDIGKHGFLFINMSADADIKGLEQHLPAGRISTSQLDALASFLNEMPYSSIAIFRYNLMIRS
jgi:hypothetical protein